MVNLKTALCGVALIGATAVITANVVMADPTTKKDAPMGGGSAEEQMMMQKMEQYGTPGPQHKLLASWDGAWNAKCTMWMAEGAPPMESVGTANCKPIFGGRYIQEKFNGEFMGKPFEGMSIAGFDNGTKEYFNFWIDSSSTGYMMANGTMDTTNKVLTSKGESYCPIREKMCAMETKVTVIDANTRKMEMFGPDMQTNKTYKCMEILYTRAK